MIKIIWWKLWKVKRVGVRFLVGTQLFFLEFDDPSLCRIRLVQEYLDRSNSMFLENVTTNNTTFSIVLRACAVLSAVKVGKVFIANYWEWVLNLICFCKLGCWICMQRLEILALQSSGLPKRDIVVHNAMIATHESCLMRCWRGTLLHGIPW